MKRCLVLLMLMTLLAAPALAQPMEELLAASPQAAALPVQAVNAPWQGETLQLNLQTALSDHNALALSWQVTPLVQSPCYLALEKVYVNGIPVPMTRGVNAGPNWLTAHAGAGLFDTSQVPHSESYTVAVSFLTLRPAGEVVYLPPTDDNTDYLAYQQQIIDWNNQGLVVSTPEGRIQLSPDSYDPGMDYVYQIMAADKVIPWENPAVTFTLVPGTQPHGLSTIADYDDYSVRAQAEFSPLSLSVTVDQYFSNTLTQAEAEALLRRYAVMDGWDNKDFYTGGVQEMGELVRREDGSWLATMTWSTQSLLSLPDTLHLTPYTYDAYMSPVYEPERQLELPLK